MNNENIGLNPFDFDQLAIIHQYRRKLLRKRSVVLDFVDVMAQHLENFASTKNEYFYF
jgi:hypothetical protein